MDMSEITEDQIKVFKAAWHVADKEGRVGERVRDGLEQVGRYIEAENTNWATDLLRASGHHAAADLIAEAYWGIPPERDDDEALPAPTVTNEMVEKACEAFYESDHGLTHWESLARTSPEIADRYRVAMRLTLEAVAGLGEIVYLTPRGREATSQEVENGLLAKELDHLAWLADGTKNGVRVPLADFTRDRMAKALREAATALTVVER